MTLLGAVLGLLAVYAVARVVARFLGWPTNLSRFVRWALLLFVVGLLLRSVPELLARLPSVSLPKLRFDGAPAGVLLAVLALAAVGYWSWSRREARASRRASERRVFVERRRAAPPAPRASGVEVAPAILPPIHPGQADPPPAEE